VGVRDYNAPYAVRERERCCPTTVLSPCCVLVCQCPGVAASQLCWSTRACLLVIDAVLRGCTMSYAVLHVSLRYPTPHRDIQKTINQNTSTLQRADAIAEELIFAVSTMYCCCGYALKVVRLPLLLCV
jgi:hypothetical protein